MRIGLKDENVDIINYKLYDGRRVMLKMTNGELTDVTFEPTASDIKNKEKCTGADFDKNYKEYQKISSSLKKAKDIIDSDYANEIKTKKDTIQTLSEKIDALSKTITNLKLYKESEIEKQPMLYDEILKYSKDNNQEQTIKETKENEACQKETNS